MPEYYCLMKRTFPKNIFAPKSRYAGKFRKKCTRQRKNTIQTTLWKDIVDEDLEIENYIKKQEKMSIPSFECESKNVREKLFPTLIPAFKKMCSITLKYNAHSEYVKFFDFLDILAEILWNINKEHSERRGSWKSMHLVNENNPFYKSRPFYLYRLFLTPDEAATIIQSWVRGYQTRLKYNLAVMKAERDKILAAAEKQLKCFRTYKDLIVNMRDSLLKN